MLDTNLDGGWPFFRNHLDMKKRDQIRGDGFTVFIEGQSLAHSLVDYESVAEYI